MRRLLLLLMLATLVSQAGKSTTSTSSSSAPLSRDQALVDRALTAMGGADALRSLRSASIKGTVKHGNRSNHLSRVARCGLPRKGLDITGFRLHLAC